MLSSKHEEIIFPLELIFMFILYFFAAIKKCYENWRILKKYKIVGGGGGEGGVGVGGIEGKVSNLLQTVVSIALEITLKMH